MTLVEKTVRGVEDALNRAYVYGEQITVEGACVEDRDHMHVVTGNVRPYSGSWRDGLAVMVDGATIGMGNHGMLAFPDIWIRKVEEG